MNTIMTLLLIGATGLRIHFPSGDALLKEIDKNMSSKNRIVISKMVIREMEESRTVVSKSWIKGKEQAFTEHLSPAREKGTKMLKLKDELWMYTPSTDRTAHISGHMLRRSVMGSDLSYEDMMEDPKLADQYDALVIGRKALYGYHCWIMELSARTEDAAYHRRRLWVDQLRHIPLLEERYAKGGKLLKKMELRDVTKIQNRWFPKRLIFKDMLKKGRGTEFIVEEILFDQPIPAHIFSKTALGR